MNRSHTENTVFNQVRMTMKPIVLILFIVAFQPLAQAEVIALTPAQIQNMQVALATVTVNNSMQKQRYSAEVVLPTDQERLVTAPQQGLIDALKVSTGQTVKKGQVLAHIASNSMVSIQSDYLQTLTKKQLAATALKRDAALLKDGIIAKRRFLETQSRHTALSAELSERKQALMLSGMSKQAIGKLAASKRMTNGISIVAPMSGQVIAQMVSLGQRLDVAAPMYKIAQLAPLWVEINVPVEHALSLKKGMVVDIPKQQASGSITAILRSLNKQTQTMHVRAEIKEGVERLAIGQLVEAVIQTKAQENQITIPRAALIRNGQKSFVFKKVNDGFEPIPVQLVSEQSKQAIVEAALKDSDKVAVSGLAALKGSWLGLGGE